MEQNIDGIFYVEKNAFVIFSQGILWQLLPNLILF